MRPTTRRTPRTALRRLTGAVCLAVAVVAAVPAAAPAAGIDGPGSYYMLRSFENGQPFTQEQDQACIDQYGAARTATSLKLNAAAFTVDGDPETGRIVDQKAGYLGPGFGCLVPTADPDALELFVAATPPTTLFGFTSGVGPCPASPVPTQPGALLLACKAQLRPESRTGVLGGLLTSATVVNPKNAVPGIPTGSLWTAYVVPGQGAKIPPPVGGAAPATPEPSPNLDFYVFRTFQDAVARSSSNCPSSLLSPVVGTRSSGLYPTEPDAEGQLGTGLGPQRGALTLCFRGTGSNRSATARVEVRRAGHTVQLSAAGDCRDYATPAGPNVRAQACNLKVESSSDSAIKGGTITSNGLVEASEPLKVANSHVWSAALFTEP